MQGACICQRRRSSPNYWLISPHFQALSKGWSLSFLDSNFEKAHDRDANNKNIDLRYRLRSRKHIRDSRTPVLEVPHGVDAKLFLHTQPQSLASANCSQVTPRDLEKSLCILSVEGRSRTLF